MCKLSQDIYYYNILICIICCPIFWDAINCMLEWMIGVLTYIISWRVLKINNQTFRQRDYFLQSNYCYRAKNRVNRCIVSKQFLPWPTVIKLTLILRTIHFANCTFCVRCTFYIKPFTCLDYTSRVQYRGCHDAWLTHQSIAPFLLSLAPSRRCTYSIRARLSADLSPIMFTDEELVEKFSDEVEKRPILYNKLYNESYI